ncbi:MAG: hypothetical protein L6R40_002118 [Gallowayella cf. fulva]|nr:MAG: hypothetical protein L6R40_002118 [Xanthomendoza cf. fulva]
MMKSDPPAIAFSGVWYCCPKGSPLVARLTPVVKTTKSSSSDGDETTSFPLVFECVGRSGLSQSFHNTIASKPTRIDNMSPLRDAESTSVILHLHCMANIHKFAVLKNHEIVFCCQHFQAVYCFGAKICNNVDMCLEERDVWSQNCKKGQA